MEKSTPMKGFSFELLKIHRMAPAVGFEPTTNRLTADRSTAELRWISGDGIRNTGRFLPAIKKLSDQDMKNYSKARISSTFRRMAEVARLSCQGCSLPPPGACIQHCLGLLTQGP